MRANARFGTSSALWHAFDGRFTKPLPEMFSCTWLLVVHATYWTLCVPSAASKPDCIEQSEGNQCSKSVSRGEGDELGLMQSMERRLAKRRRAKPAFPTALLSMDAEIASSFRARRADPQTIATAVLEGVSAIQAVIPFFMAEPPEIGRGISELGPRLLACVDPVIADALQDSVEYERFKSEWNKFFDELPTTVSSIEADIRAFTDNADTGRLISGIATIFAELVDGVMSFLPPATADEVGKYFDAVSDVFMSIGDSWADFENGRTPEGIETIFFGLRNATEPLLPDSIRNDQTYQLIVGTLDHVIGGISETVMDYRKHMVEARVCWKAFVGRERKRPEICPDGFHWNGEQFCFPAAAAMLLQQRNNVSLEASVHRKGTDTTTQAKVPNGAVPARCDEDSTFPVKVNHWCYAPCADGYESIGEKCRTVCRAEFHADDGNLMCGESQGFLMQAVMQMVMTTVNAVVTVSMQIAQMAERGVQADSLKTVIQTFIDMGKPFAYNTCFSE